MYKMFVTNNLNILEDTEDPPVNTMVAIVLGVVLAVVVIIIAVFIFVRKYANR